MAKNRFIVFLAAAALAFAAHAEEVLKGVVTFSGDEFLVVAPEDRPHWRGTLVRLVKEDGTRAMGPERFTPGECVAAHGKWVAKDNPLEQIFAAAMVKRRPGFIELPEGNPSKDYDWRVGNLSLSRIRLEGIIVSIEEELQDDGSVRTYIVLSRDRKHKAVCVHGHIQAPEI